MEFRILGPLEVVADGRQVPVTGARERALLAILLIHAGEVVSAERLIGELWGSDLPANLSNALQMVVSRVRRALEVPPGRQRELLVTRKPGYLLDVAPHELDARRFRQLADQARQVAVADPSLASSLLAEALGLWRGPALAEFALEDFAREEIARLEEARIRAVEMKIEAELALGRHAELAAEVTTAPRSNLPAPVTSFVGRRSELWEVGRLLAISRLVTLTGPGGCGKTRLSLEVARADLASFPDGVWLAELEAVTDPALVPQAVGAPLGIRDGASLGVGGEVLKPLADRLVDFLREKELLIVLDNCEHLIEVCARFAERLLQLAPRVRLLVTSRECLGVAGEVLWPVPPLGLPDAVRLFEDRATAVQPAFALDPAVRHICRRLDGIPLAIELAAARVGVLPPREIAARLVGRFGNRPTLPRHQTLQAVIDWSCQLLPVPERALFGQLSVFAGGFTLEAAEEVCGAGGAELSRLVEQSLIVPGDGRFRMLDTLRRYAAERVPEPQSLRRRHAEYLLRLAERAEPLLRGPRQGTWLRRLEADHDNFSAALDWAFGHDPELAVRLSSALAYYWLIGRHRSEVRHHLAEAVDIVSGVPAASRAKALVWAAQLGNIEGRMDQAAWQAREAYQLAKDGEDPWLFAMSEAILGLTLGLLAETSQTTELLESARARFAGIGDKWGIAVATMLSGLVSMSAAQSEQAAALTRRSLEDFRGAGDQWGQTLALELLGLLARHRGAYEYAVAGYEEALGVVRDLGLRDEIPFLLVDLGDLHVLLEDVEAAAVLYQEALDLAQELGAMDAVTLARNGLAEVARLWNRH